jgi:hypothetical protein
MVRRPKKKPVPVDVVKLPKMPQRKRGGGTDDEIHVEPPRNLRKKTKPFNSGLFDVSSGRLHCSECNVDVGAGEELVWQHLNTHHPAMMATNKHVRQILDKLVGNPLITTNTNDVKAPWTTAGDKIVEPGEKFGQPHTKK